MQEEDVGGAKEVLVFRRDLVEDKEDLE